AQPVLMANGTELGGNGVKPDIDVTVSPDHERLYYADAFSVVRAAGMAGATNGAGTNQVASVRRPRFGEAELVREHRAGVRRSNGEAPVPAATGLSPDSLAADSTSAERAVVNDPALARG